MGWGARTHEGRFHSRRSTPVRLMGKLHHAFKPGGRGRIGVTNYVVALSGAIRRVRPAVTITKRRAA